MHQDTIKQNIHSVDPFNRKLLGKGFSCVCEQAKKGAIVFRHRKEARERERPKKITHWLALPEI